MSVLKLYHAIGLKELFGILNWKYCTDPGFPGVYIPLEHFKTLEDLYKWCDEVGIQRRDNEVLGEATAITWAAKQSNHIGWWFLHLARPAGEG